MCGVKVLRNWLSRKCVVWRFSAIDHQESVWERRVTEKDRLGKEDWSSIHHWLSLSCIKVSLSWYHIYYVRIIDSKILWTYVYDCFMKLWLILHVVSEHGCLNFMILHYWSFFPILWTLISNKILKELWITVIKLLQIRVYVYVKMNDCLYCYMLDIVYKINCWIKVNFWFKNVSISVLFIYFMNQGYVLINLNSYVRIKFVFRTYMHI